MEPNSNPGESASFPPQEVAEERFSPLALAGYILALVLGLGGGGWYLVKFFTTPIGRTQTAAYSKAPAASSPQAAPTLPTPQAASQSSAVSSQAAPVPAAEPGAPRPTLLQIAQREAARQAQPPGPLYQAGAGEKEIPVVFSPQSIADPAVVEAAQVIQDYLQAPSWRERLPFVFKPERAEARMREYYEKRGQPEPEPGALKGAGTLSAESSKVEILLYDCAHWPETGLRANFHRTRGGRLLLDWEAWVGWCERDWDEFKTERSQLDTTMRVVASESSYYNYEFSESWRWLAVKLRSADGLHSVTGYVERNTLLGVAMANLIGVPIPHQLPQGTAMPSIKPPGTKSLVTVKLRFPASAQSNNCVMITDLLAERWLLFAGDEK